VHGLLDEGLRGIVFLAGAVLVMGIAWPALRRIFPVRREVVANWAIAGGEGCCGCWCSSGARSGAICVH